MKLRILGCGTSSGVPRIGNDWGNCDPDEPRNRRSRASVLVSLGGFRVLVDTGPDMREQLLAAKVGTVDAVIWTHEHADHCHGLDDLRQVMHNRRSPVPVYARPEVLDILRERFSYVFEGNAGYPELVEARPLLDRQRIGPLEVDVIDMPHGPIVTSGLKFSDGLKTLAYITDFGEFTEDMEYFFTGCDLMVIDALRRNPHPTHPHLALTLDAIAHCRPGHAILTHMDSSMDYAELRHELPMGVEPGYDGMEVDL